MISSFSSMIGYSYTLSLLVSIQMGIEFKEPGYTLNAANEKTIRAGMVFNLSLGFQGLEIEGEVKDQRKKV